MQAKNDVWLDIWRTNKRDSDRKLFDVNVILY